MCSFVEIYPTSYVFDSLYISYLNKLMLDGYYKEKTISATRDASAK